VMPTTLPVKSWTANAAAAANARRAICLTIAEKMIG
jgi:hypothetical protein